MELVTLILLLGIGYLAKKVGYLSAESAKHFLDYIFYIGFPALTFYSIAKLEFDIGAIYLLISNIILTVVLTHLSIFIAKLLKLPPHQQGSFVAASVIMNYSLIYVFAYKLFGPKGLLYMSFFTSGHTISALTYTYLIIKSYNPHTKKEHLLKIIKDLFKTPLVLSLILGILVSINKISLPPIIVELIKTIGESSIPLVLITLGSLMDLALPSYLVILASILRIIGGFIIGVIITYLLPLNDIQKWIVIIGSMAPTGFMAAVYSNVENLDTKLAANAISFSLILSTFLLIILSYLGNLFGWF